MTRKPPDETVERARRAMPAQKPHTSDQTKGTPPEFLDAVEAKFGKLEWDLAASAENCVVRNGEGGRSRQFFSEEEDSLAQDWGAIGGLHWCNPPFRLIGKFMQKAAEQASPTTRILVLTPASVGANWYWDFVRPHAVVYALHPRLVFVGEKDPFPKDLMLSVFGFGAVGMARWRWKPAKKTGGKKKR